MKKLSILIPVDHVKQNYFTSDKGYKNYSFKIDLKAGCIITVKGEEIKGAKYSEIEMDGNEPDLFNTGVKVTMNIDHLSPCIQNFNDKNFLFFDIVQKSPDFIERNPDFGRFSAVYYNEQSDSYEYLKGVFIHNLSTGFGRKVSLVDFFAPQAPPAAAPANAPVNAPVIGSEENDDLPF